VVRINRKALQYWKECLWYKAALVLALDTAGYIDKGKVILVAE
jgi:hypothetical protein